MWFLNKGKIFHEPHLATNLVTEEKWLSDSKPSVPYILIKRNISNFANEKVRAREVKVTHAVLYNWLTGTAAANT